MLSGQAEASASPAATASDAVTPRGAVSKAKSGYGAPDIGSCRIRQRHNILCRCDLKIQVKYRLGPPGSGELAGRRKRPLRRERLTMAKSSRSWRTIRE